LQLKLEIEPIYLFSFGKGFFGGLPFHTVSRARVIIATPPPDSNGVYRSFLDMLGTMVALKCLELHGDFWRMLEVRRYTRVGTGQSICPSLRSIVQGRAPESRKGAEVFRRFVNIRELNGPPLEVSTGAVWKHPEQLRGEDSGGWWMGVENNIRVYHHEMHANCFCRNC
jgi:hypothetical protein